MSCDPSRICRHCSMFACGEATDPSEMCREAILERLATAEAASRPVFSRRLLEHRLAAAEARVRALEEAARDMCREWRLHGQLTDSARPMERLLGIHAPFCPIHSGNDCECDIALAPPPEAEKKGGE